MVVYIVALIVVLFGFVVFYGAPYLPTLRRQTEDAIDLLGVKRDDTVLELGCGDGRILVAVAKRGGNAVGYELNPLLFAFSWLRVWPYRRQVKVIFGNYWHKQWPEAQAIYVFLLEKYMRKLDKKIIQHCIKQQQNIRLVSFAFKIPEKKIAKQKNGLYAYTYKI